MVHTVVLTIHIIAGGLGMLLGPVAIWSIWRRRAQTPSGEAYHAMVALVCLSAVGLAVLDWSALWWFVLVSAASYAFAFRAYRAIRRGQPGWLSPAVRGLGGSYIALTTAILVVSVPGLWVTWLLPTALGAPLVEWASHRAKSVSRVDA